MPVHGESIARATRLSLLEHLRRNEKPLVESMRRTMLASLDDEWLLKEHEDIAKEEEEQKCPTLQFTRNGTK
eukprot:764239-Hanusia_phi.AAC.1